MRKNPKPRSSVSHRALVVALLAAAIVGCGRSRREVTDRPSAPAGSGGSDEAGGGMRGVPEACPMPPPAPPDAQGGPPSSFGCAELLNGTWVELPCNCALWLENSDTLPHLARIGLTFTPPDSTPSLTDAPDVEVAFPDASGDWARLWSNDPGAGTSFTVTQADGTTTVRLGVAQLGLLPVTLPACTRVDATAKVSGPWGTRWDLQMFVALLEYGIYAPDGSFECFQPASHPTPAGGPADGSGGAAQ
jgi:hypothetical protein